MIVAELIAKAPKPRPVYKPNGVFDCDKFALGFYFFATLADSRSKTEASPLIARIVVDMPFNQRHELNAAFTDEGVFVVEPQPDAGPFRALRFRRAAPVPPMNKIA